MKSTLAEIKLRCERATSGRWRAQGLQVLCDGRRLADVYLRDGAAQSEATAEFLASSRTDVARLIAALELAIEQRNKAMQGNWDKASIEEVGECIVEDDSALEAILKGSET